MDRYLVREEYVEKPATGSTGYYWLKIWTFHYSDGATETVTVRERKR